MKIKLFEPECMPVKAEGGDWYDLKAAENMWVMPNREEPVMIPLGVAMEIPEDMFAMVVPRSSTPKKHGILMANSVGIIDSAYNGPCDQWYFPAITTRKRGSLIKKGTRIAQFHLFKKNPEIEFEESDLEHNTNRGGFGSTGN